jgi:hypothetical protein
MVSSSWHGAMGVSEMEKNQDTHRNRGRIGFPRIAPQCGFVVTLARKVVVVAYAVRAPEAIDNYECA